MTAASGMSGVTSKQYDTDDGKCFEASFACPWTESKIEDVRKDLFGVMVEVAPQAIVSRTPVGPPAADGSCCYLVQFRRVGEDMGMAQAVMFLQVSSTAEPAGISVNIASLPCPGVALPSNCMLLECTEGRLTIEHVAEASPEGSRDMAAVRARFVVRAHDTVPHCLLGVTTTMFKQAFKALAAHLGTPKKRRKRSKESK